MDGSGSAKVCNVIAKKTRVEIQISLLATSILEMEQLAGTSFCNDIINILSVIEFVLNIFKTRIEDVDRCRLPHESVVHKGLPT